VSIEGEWMMMGFVGVAARCCFCGCSFISRAMMMMMVMVVGECR